MEHRAKEKERKRESGIRNEGEYMVHRGGSRGNGATPGEKERERDRKSARSIAEKKRNRSLLSLSSRPFLSRFLFTTFSFSLLGIHLSLFLFLPFCSHSLFSSVRLPLTAIRELPRVFSYSSQCNHR